MEKNNLIKFTDHFGVSLAIHFLGMLPEREKYKQKDYRHYGFERKKKMVVYLAKILNPELEKLKDKVKSSGIEPSIKWEMNTDFLPAFTLLQSYFVFVKSYVESLVGFITLYLEDLKERGVDVGEINKKNKYLNLKKFNIDEDSLNKLNKIRSLSIHSKEEGDYNFALMKTNDGDLEPCLIEMEYTEDTPQEKHIYYYHDLIKILQTADGISLKFSNYIKDLLRKS